MARSKELTPREKEFAKEFVRTGNAYKSALKVGYDDKRLFNSQTISNRAILNRFKT